MTQNISIDVKFRSTGHVITGFKKSSDKNTVTNIVIPKEIDGFEITVIAPSAFRRCKALKSVRIDGNVRIIENEAFYGCNALESVEISGKVKIIGAYAFENCNNLKKLILGANLRLVYGCAFKGCESVSEVIYHGREEDWQEVDFFNQSADPTHKGARIHFCEK